ncbi:ATP-binding protein [Lancefieldella rimae]|uniref:ATP-binding protein n=1 Tax=Lancefieldella rimae TaxID=1383 RepID=UPI002880A5F9|nr:ATP-binding protein [Lancefieldella rimae]
MIKVITGVRRCGKSCIMLSIADELRDSGIPDENIAFIDLDLRINRKVKTPDALEELIDRTVSPDAQGTKYLFIDEIQNVRGFEELVNGYRTDGGWSIFITGSNSYLLSGELATKLTGRYLEFEVFTLDFAEYLGMKRYLGKEVSSNLSQEFAEYIRIGGFPKSVEYDGEQDKRSYVQGVVQEIFEKDVKRSNKIRNVSVFNAVRDYLINNFGATTSLKNLLEHFNRVEKVSIKRETLNRYIQILVDAKIIYRCQRFDMKSRKSLARDEKYYLADLGLYFAMNTDARINYGPALENVTYQYLRSLGYMMSVGRIGTLECDFVARRAFGEYFYIQVAMTIADRATENREYRPFEKITDSYPRYLFTLDPLLQQREGVRHLNLMKFIASGGDLVSSN